MLTLSQIALIERQFAAGEKLPAIAAEVGCALQTVYDVVNGRHPLQKGRRRKVARHRFDIDHEYESGVGFRHVDGPVNCPGCGGKINQLPCVLCATLAERAGAGATPESPHRN